MKTKTMILTATTLLLAGTAMAAPFGAGKGGPGPMQAIDADKDGVITRQEIDAARAARFAGLDKDGDGKATIEEFEAHRQEMMQQRMLRHFQRHDTNGDGVVTREEHDASADRMMARKDRNGDGQITADEMRGRKHHRGGCRTK